MPSPRTVRRVAGLLAVALLAACSDRADDSPLAEGAATDQGADGSDQPAAGGEVPDGWQRITGDGVSLAVPGDWVDVPLDEFEMGAEDLQDALPEADEAMLEQAASVVQQGGVLLAFGPPGASGFTDNINVLALPVSAELEELEQQAELGLGAVGAELASKEVVEVPSGRAVRVSYSLELDGAEGPYTVRGVQYYVVADGRTFVLTVSALDAPDELADQVADTFEVA